MYSHTNTYFHRHFTCMPHHMQMHTHAVGNIIVKRLYVLNCSLYSEMKHREDMTEAHLTKTIQRTQTVHTRTH